MTSPLAYEKVWFEKFKYDEAERHYFEKLAKGSSNTSLKNSLAGEVAKVRQHIQNSLECMDGIAVLASNVNVEIVSRITSMETKNQELTKLVQQMQSQIKDLTSRVIHLESNSKDKAASGAAKPTRTPAKPAAAPPTKAEKADDEDDGVDLFASDSDEDAEAIKKAKEEVALSKKKSKKQEIIQKSIIVFDVKPWDDETDMKAMEVEVRKITTDGLIWGASKLVPLAYGINKLQISCVVEDEKVSVDWLQETMQEIEDYVQSVDIYAFNKV